MSIWSSVGGDIRALDGHDEAANYRAEGEPSITIDVATTAAHDHVRLSLWDEAALDVCAVLAPDAVRELRDSLTAALELVERRA